MKINQRSKINEYWRLSPSKSLSVKQPSSQGKKRNKQEMQKMVEEEKKKEEKNNRKTAQ